MNAPIFQTLNTQRAENEYDLLQASVMALLEGGVDKARVQQYYLGAPDIQAIVHLTAPEQMFAMSRFWELQLMYVSLTKKEDTQPHRYVLSSSSDPSAWMTLFIAHIVPMCLNSVLPTDANAMGLYRYQNPAMGA